MLLEQTELAGLRTAELWSKSYQQLVGSVEHPGVLVGRTMMMASDLDRPLVRRRRIELLGLIGWPREQNIRQYKALWDMDPGIFWVCPVQGHKQGLISALEAESTKGACIQLKGGKVLGQGVRIFDLLNQTYIPARTNRDIPDYLDLEMQSRGRLLFLDDSPILYYVPQNQEIAQVKGVKQIIDPSEADSQLAQILQGSL